MKTNKNSNKTICMKVIISLKDFKNSTLKINNFLRNKLRRNSKKL